MRGKYGSWKVPWGQTVVLERGDMSYPLGGGSFENGLSALRSIWGVKTGAITVGTGGQSGPMVVALTSPIQSVSVLPWGQSDDPDSPHYMDQGEELFSRRKLKPTWFEFDELQEHIESEIVLEFAPIGR